MLCILLTESGPLLGTGEPQMFLDDKNLAEALSKQDKYDELLSALGGGVTVGRLGELGTDGVYDEGHTTVIDYSQGNKESLGYYAKI